MKNTITDIQFNKGKNQDRVYIYIDYAYCISIRSRTWGAFGLKIGDTIKCTELQEKENFLFKNVYQNSWEEEKVRINYVKSWLNKYLPSLEVVISGFGADSNEFIKSHPSEKGEPDITLRLKETDTIVLFLEVTGTKHKQGDDYWVRPDKIDYIQKHQEKDVWIALHYADDKKIIWLKIVQNKKYIYVEKKIKNVIEHYVLFDDNSEEVKSSQEFKAYVENKLQSLTNVQ